MKFRHPMIVKKRCAFYVESMVYILCLVRCTYSLTQPRFPHVLGRMGHMDTLDRQLFCLCALDFYRQLTEEPQRRAFVSTFQAIASPDTPYTDLVACLV